MSKNGLREFTFGAFDGGLNSQTFRSSIKNNELSDCFNMFFYNGALTTRPGVTILNEFYLTDEEKGYDIKPIGSMKHTNEGGFKLFLVSRNESGIFYNNILVLRQNGKINYFQLLNFDSDYYENGIGKVNCIVFNGKETIGAGVYILLGVIDTVGNVCGKYIFELNSDFSSVSRIDPSQIYAPLVYLNGRGNNYNTLSSSIKTFPSPKVLEDYNMLSSGFRAAFTTDSASDTFYLPVKNLSANKGENIEISYTDSNGNKYNWTISYDDIYSELVNVGGTKYKFTVNRNAGKVYSSDESGTKSSLPVAEGINNNLIIKAYKAPENDRLFKMTVSENFNSRVFLSGNSSEGNLICFSKRNNPLYFPTSNLAFFGDKTSNVVAIKPHNDRLVVFKAYEIGVCSSVKYSEYSVDSVLSGNSSRASVNEKMEVKTVNTGVGCIYPDTILSCANRLVFWGSDKRVYTMTSTSNYLHRFYRISDKIDSKLCGFFASYNAFAMDWNRRYMLFADNKCFTFDYDTPEFLASTTANGSKSKKDVAWFYLNYNFGLVKPFYAMCIKEKVMIMTRFNAYGGAKKVVCYTFSGIKDCASTSLVAYRYDPIQSSFATAVSDLDNEHIKRIVGIEFTFSTELSKSDDALSLEYMNENKSVYVSDIVPDGRTDKEIVIKKTPCICGERRFGVSLDRNAFFGIKQIKVIYRQAK